MIREEEVVEELKTLVKELNLRATILARHNIEVSYEEVDIRSVDSPVHVIMLEAKVRKIL